MILNEHIKPPYVVLLSRNNVYVGTYTIKEFEVIRENVCSWWEEVEFNVLKTRTLNSTKLRYEINFVLKDYRW